MTATLDQVALPKSLDGLPWLQPIDFVAADAFEEAESSDELLVTLSGTEGDWRGRPGGPEDGPLLTVEQERHLFRKMNFLKFRAERLRQQIDSGVAPAGAEDRLRAKLRDAVAIRDELILRNARLVAFVAKRFLDRHHSLEELVSAGQPTLIRAVELFDFGRGFRFCTYASWALRNFYVRLAKRRSRAARTGFRGGTDVFATLIDERADPDSERRHVDAVSELIRDGILELPQRQQLVVTRRFGLDGSPPRRFREIGEELGVSTERARQILGQALTRMRAHEKFEGLTAEALCFRDPLH